MSEPDTPKKSHLFSIKNKDFQHVIILLVIYIIIVTVWSYVALFRLYHLYSAVFDLGLFAEDLWLPLHTVPTFTGILYQLFYVSIIPYLLSPLSLMGSLRVILVVQTVFIWAAAFPLYFISRKFGLSPVLSLLISVCYFFYFPIAGINFFDVHKQAFFPFFFILSYTFYIYGHKKTSMVLFAITALIKWPYEIFVILFAFYELVSYFFNRRKAHLGNKNLVYPFILFAFSSSALVLGYGISFLGGPMSVSSLHISPPTQTFPLGNIAITVMMILAPVFFLPLYSNKWVLFLIPFFVLMAIANNAAYFFPDIYTDQFLSMVVPFLFLGIIDVLSVIYRGEPKYRAPQKKLSRIYKEIRSSQTAKIVVSVLILLVLLSIVFQPWSPLSSDNGYISWYKTNPYDNVNTYTYLSEEAAMIPRSNPYVLVPNNIPEAYPRAIVGGPYHVGAFVMGFPSPVFLNITVGDAINNTFPYIAARGHIVYVPLDYAISTITNAVAFSNSGYQSMVQIMDIMLESGKYGILAEANGTIVLERNYAYPPALYVPMNGYIEESDGCSPAGHQTVNNSLIFSNTSSGSVMWYGGTKYYPGTYNDTLHFFVYPESYGNLSITAVLNGTSVSEQYIHVNDNSSDPSWYNLSFNQIIDNINLNTGYYYFIIRSDGWTGKVAFSGISEMEVSYKW